MTDTAAVAAIGAATRELRLPMVRAESRRLAELAQRSQLSYLAYLAEVLSAECDERAERRRQRRIHEARFPRMKRLADFDTAAAPTVNPTTIATLAAGSYLDAGEPVVLLGESGTGKSHLLIGLGVAACEQGRRVRYLTTAQLVNELVEAADERRLSRIVARYGRLDLLCLDEFGYVQLDSRGAELLFQVITEREEKASIATVSNLPFSEWGQIIPDPRLVAIVDRVTFHAHIIETGTESYRLKVTRASRPRKKTPPPGGARSGEHDRPIRVDIPT
ncbi:MAG: IS21-like element helper ATPase IstB [Acidimicrobiia bacterium]